MLLYAHVAHHLIWLLYAVPVLIVSGAIVRSTIAQRRAGRGVADRDRKA